MAKISFCFDEMMPRKVANQLIERGYKVVMAVDVLLLSEFAKQHSSEEATGQVFWIKRK